MTSSQRFDCENRALVELIRQGYQNGMRLLYLRNRWAVWKIFSRTYPREWVEAQAYLFMVRCIKNYNEAKQMRFLTYWIEYCKKKLPHAWECEVSLIRLPSKPTHKRNDPNRGEDVLFMEDREECGSLAQMVRAVNS